MKIRVDKDNLRIIKLSQLESGEVDVTEVNFIFTPEYKDLIKTAVFTLGDKSYKVILQNDKCFVPTEVLVEGNKITIGVYAFKQDSEELLLRYSPVPVTAEILKGSYVEEAENTSHPTPTEIEQLLDLINSNSIAIDDLTERVDTLEQDKDKCKRDIDSIKEDLIDIKSDIQDLEDDVTSINNSINDINGNIDEIEGDIDTLEGNVSDINTSITNINQLDERQNRRLNGIDNFIRQWPKTEYQTGTNINLGKTIEAVVQYEDDKVMYGDTSQAILPSEYQQVEYLKSTGTQYIDTGVKGSSNTRVLLDFKDNNDTSTARFIVGSRISYDNANYGFVSLNATQFRTDYFGMLSTLNFTKVVGTRYVVDKNKGVTTLYQNGTQLAQTTQTQPAFSNNLNMYLFNLNDNGTPRNEGGLIDLYNCKIYDNETLVRDYIPCYRISDNVIGLYDLVGKQFYTNSGTGTFTKGGNSPTPESPIPISVVTGTQEIEVKNGNNETQKTYTIHLGNLELAKIGTYQDYIYFDVDEGKWYKKTQIKKFIFNGSETNWKTSSLVVSGFKSYYIENVNVGHQNTNNWVALCSHFEQKPFSDWTGLTASNFFETASNNIGFRLAETLATDLTAFKTWLSNNTPTFYAVLGSTLYEDIEITDTTLIEDLDEIYAMMSVEGTTIIEVSGELGGLSGIVKLRAYAQLQAAT